MRQVLKRALLLVMCLVNLPWYLLYRLLAKAFPPDRFFAGLSQCYSLIPGTVGDHFRRAFYFMSLKKCSPDVTIAFGTFFPSPAVELGSYVYIGANCIVGQAVIGDDVMLGSNIQVISGKMTHNFSDIDTPVRLQGGEDAPVFIGDDSWIGNSSVIMADIGRKCIIGAASVVTKPVEAFSVAVGNPARVVKKRAEIGQVEKLPVEV